MRVDELQIHDITRPLAPPFDHREGVAPDRCQRNPNVHKCKPLLECAADALLALVRFQQRSGPREAGAHSVVSMNAEGWARREHRRGNRLASLGLLCISVCISGDVVEDHDFRATRKFPAQHALRQRIESLAGCQRVVQVVALCFVQRQCREREPVALQGLRLAAGIRHEATPDRGVRRLAVLGGVSEVREDAASAGGRGSAAPCAMPRTEEGRRQPLQSHVARPQWQQTLPRRDRGCRRRDLNCSHRAGRWLPRR
mmetsp:Transcript_146651/g.372192  ORF Transcript_146651/g.372192 Transcript_146651/m.372192 type:complete len:256 (-) Transcript_146651:38-805(-)